MPGVAGAGVEGVARDGLLADLRGAVALRVATTGITRAGAGASVGAEARVTATLRCDAETPRSTQCSGSS